MGSGQLSDGNLWLHFTRPSDWVGEHATIPVLDRGKGCYVWDANGKLPIVAEMPHGGFKSSGHGKDLSLYGFEDYTRIKHVMSNIEL